MPPLAVLAALAAAVHGGHLLADPLWDASPSAGFRASNVSCISAGAGGDAQCLPAFIGIGTQKGGTTAFWEALARGVHPDVVSPRRKELHFFSGTFGKGFDWYYKRWDPAPPHRLRTEKTPRYLDNPWAPQRVARSLPYVKLVVLLRDPIERMISHYHMAKRERWDHLLQNRSIDEIARDEIALAQSCFEEASVSPGTDAERASAALFGCLFDADGAHSESKLQNTFVNYFVLRGIYLFGMARWLDFFARPQILVIDNAQLRSDPLAAFSTLFRFLGLDPARMVAKHLPDAHQRAPHANKLAADTRADLSRFYAPFNQALFAKIGATYSWQ